MGDEFWFGALTAAGCIAALAMLLAPWWRSREAAAQMIAPWIYWATFGLVSGLGFGPWLPGAVAAVFGGFLIGLLVSAVARDYGQVSNTGAVALGFGAAAGTTVGYLGSLYMPAVISGIALVAIASCAIAYRRPAKSGNAGSEESSR